MIHTLRGMLASRHDGPLGVALVYHGVTAEPQHPARRLVPPLELSTLVAHLDWLSRRFRLVRASALFDEAHRRRRGDTVPLALTFDDDLASHATLVAPELQRRNLPATFFLGGAGLDESAERPWWEVLEDAAYAAPGEALRGKSLRDAAAAMERLSRIERDHEVGRLAALVDSHQGEAPIGDEGIRRLVDAGMEVGFHTRHHDRLPDLDHDPLVAALTDGRDRLEGVAGSRISCIAYPHGAASPDVARAARECGYEWGFTTDWSPVGPDTDRLRIGRVHAWESRVGLRLDVRATLGRGM